MKGAWGENAAAEWLVSRGWHILERNYRTRFGELDIIAENMRFPTLNFEAFSISAILRILKLINASKTHFSINNSKSYYKMRKTFFFWFVQFHIVLEVYEPQTLV